MDFDLDEYFDASQGMTDPTPRPEDTSMTLLPPPVNEDYYTARDLISAVQQHAKEQSYAVVRRRSKTKKGVQNAVYLRCDMGGRRRDYKQLRSPTKRRHLSTRMTECPFKVVARRRAASGMWEVDVEVAEHNHGAIGVMGHPAYRKKALTKDISDFIGTETRIHVRPGQILSAIQLENPDIPLDIEDIYNEKASIRRRNLQYGTPIQALMRELSRLEDWTMRHAEDGINRLTHLFFAHEESLKLLALFPEVIIMDCTYKTNRFRMPLLNILGITSLHKNFWIGFCFLRNEAEPDFRWVLLCIRTLYRRIGLRGPKVILTDRAWALINALGPVFPDCQHLLCLWHIKKDVQSYCQPSFESDEEWKAWEADWLALINSSTPAAYDTAWGSFQDKWNEKYLLLTEYLEKTWLRPWKRQFVKAWTDCVTHFNTIVTSRAEGSHHVLKQALGTSGGDLLQVLEDIKLILTRQTSQYNSRLA